MEIREHHRTHPDGFNISKSKRSGEAALKKPQVQLMADVAIIGKQTVHYTHPPNDMEARVAQIYSKLKIL
jgi:hypothetical protein